MGAGALTDDARPEGVAPRTSREVSHAGRRRVALLLESDGPGGAEQMLLNLASELRLRGHGVVPVGPAEGEGWLPARFRERGFEPESYRLGWPMDPRCLADLTGIFRRRDVDVVHSHEFSMAVFGAAAARITGRRHVITMHGGRYYAGRWRRRAVLRWAFRASDDVVAVSAATRDDLARTLGVERTGIRVTPNGVHPLEGSPEPVREELGTANGELLILAVGNLYPVKGHDTLVRALARVRGSRPELRWRAAVAGRGEEEARLKSLAADLDVGDRIRFLGFRDDIDDLLAACDVFALPSRSEGLPLALLEAMHAGAAVVATDVGGVPEVVTAGREALLVPPDRDEALASALIRVLEDERLRRRLGRRARRKARERFSVGAMADAYEDLYGWSSPSVAGEAA